MTELEIKLTGSNSGAVELTGNTPEIEIDLTQEEIGADLSNENAVDIEFESSMRVVMPKNHNELLGLDYENSGHTGFASTAQLEAVKKTPAKENALGMVKVGENLNITDDGVLSVTTTDGAAGDNTKPITSKAVHTIVGNIDSLLSII